MNKPRLSKEEINEIVDLRKKGHSFSEIIKFVPKSKSTIHRYVKNVVVSGKSKLILDNKQRGSKTKFESKIDWDFSKNIISKKIGELTERDLILIGGILYWGEGNKKYELNIINSDSVLLKIFIQSLLLLGVHKDRIKISLRLYSDLDEKVCIEYWIKELGLTKINLVSVNYLDGKKKGKLKYGMCRLRVKKGGLYFKQLISIIDYVKGRCSSMDRIAHS